MSNVTFILEKLDFNDSNNSYFEEIQTDVWLMDNHKWALYCWELYKNTNKTIPSTIVHLDYHWDGINDYYEDEEKIDNIELSQLKKIIVEDNYIRKDSFIAPAIIRGYINRIDFHCFQTDTEIGIDNYLLKKYHCEQYVHREIEDLLLSIHNKPIILDIDLDIFNRSDYFLDGELWSNKEIQEYLSKITPLIQQAKIITIAMSYGHSGSNKDREYLTKFVVPKIIAIRNTH